MRWTLEHAGVERDLAAWGLVAESVTLTRGELGADTLTAVAATADCLGPLLFDFDAVVVVRRDRTGSGTTWAGGSIYFVGRATVPRRSGAGAAERLQYRFDGPWFDLERQIYHQQWTNRAGGTFTASEVFLGRTLAGAALNSGQQITDALNWAIGCGVLMQVGVIDPAVNIFYINARSVSCAEVIRTMLRNTPDSVGWWDYTTLVSGQPRPTWHCRRLANLDPLTLTLGAEKFTALELTPRHDLQVPSVVIHFKRVNQVDGESRVQWTRQAAPPDADGRARGGEVHVVELEGFNRTTARASVETEPVLAQSAGLATRIAWWKKKERTLEAPAIKPSTLTVTVASITDETGAPVSLAQFPNELVDGQVAEWMNAGVRGVTVKALVSYELYADAAHTAALKIQTVRNRELIVRLRVTDAVTGDYSTIASFVEGESEPSGLAAAYHGAMQTLQYDGQLSLVEQELPTTRLVGRRLTLAGGAISITNQLVQSVTEQPHFGRYTVNIGPANRLGIRDLVERHNATRFRRIYNLPSTRTTGLAGGGGELALGKSTPRENTTGGLGEREVTSQTALDGANRNFITGDATEKKLVMLVRNATTGAEVPSAGKVLIELSRAHGKEIKVREAKVCLPNGETRYVLTLSSEPYATPLISGETPIGSDTPTP